VFLFSHLKFSAQNTSILRKSLQSRIRNFFFISVTLESSFTRPNQNILADVTKLCEGDEITGLSRVFHAVGFLRIFYMECFLKRRVRALAYCILFTSYCYFKSGACTRLGWSRDINHDVSSCMCVDLTFRLAPS